VIDCDGDGAVEKEKTAWEGRIARENVMDVCLENDVGEESSFDRESYHVWSEEEYKSERAGDSDE
jgi:hypothetical protein